MFHSSIKIDHFNIILRILFFLPFREPNPSYNISPRGDSGSRNVGRWDVTDILKEYFASSFRVQE
jgi:hypothetical protein